MSCSFSYVSDEQVVLQGFLVHVVVLRGLDVRVDNRDLGRKKEKETPANALRPQREETLTRRRQSVASSTHDLLHSFTKKKERRQRERHKNRRADLPRRMPQTGHDVYVHLPARLYSCMYISTDIGESAGLVTRVSCGPSFLVYLLPSGREDKKAPECRAEVDASADFHHLRGVGNDFCM